MSVLLANAYNYDFNLYRNSKFIHIARGSYENLPLKICKSWRTIQKKTDQLVTQRVAVVSHGIIFIFIYFKTVVITFQIG